MTDLDLLARSWADFQPHRLLRSGHAQTIFAGLWSAARIPYAARQYHIATTGDDQLVLHEDRPGQWQDGDRCALLVHGLGGSHASPYMVRTAHKLAASGIRTFRMDQRGCGSGFRLAQQPGHAGRSEDVHAALEFVLRTCPRSPLVLVGFSLGANLVLKLLGELGDRVPAQLQRALAVAPPIDLLACSQNMEHPRMTLYNRWFMRSLLQQVGLRKEYMPQLATLDWSRRPRTLLEFDDLVTAPLSGFAGAHDYYARSSSRELLGEIRTPTLILAAADDPIVPVHVFDAVGDLHHARLLVTRHGGHVGFFGQAGRDPDRFWLDWRVVDFVLEHGSALIEEKRRKGLGRNTDQR